MSSRYKKSEALFHKAKTITPGGIHSTQRNFKPFPLFFKKAHGSKVEDLDGNEYIDYHLGFGSVILGHNHPAVVKAVKEQLEIGDLWGLGGNELEYQVAEMIVRHLPSAEMVRFCNSGSEATYHAVRLARAYTKRKKLLKFEGAYHGWHDYLNIGVSPTQSSNHAQPESEGTLPEASQHTMVAPFNDLEATEKIITKHQEDLAAVFVEPFMHNCGIIMPGEGFLEGLAEITQRLGILQVFDEVITGFRHGLGGAQEALGITPDLTTLGKAFANGFPAAAVCGSKEIMSRIQPTGGVDVSGTYSGHPISMVAARASIRELEKGEVYQKMNELSRYLAKEIKSIISDLDLDAQVQQYRSIFTVYFTKKTIFNYRALKRHNNQAAFHRYASKLREEGILITPNSRKRSHLSASHTQEDAQKTLTAIERSLAAVKDAEPNARGGYPR